MKLKKLLKIFPYYEQIRVWGEDEEVPLYKGSVDDIPERLMNKKLTPGDCGSYVELRTGCVDCEDHIAVFVEE